MSSKRHFIGLTVFLVMVAVLGVACGGGQPAAEPAAPAEQPAVEEQAAAQEEAAESKAAAEMPEELWYDPALLDEPWINICVDSPPRSGGTVVTSLADSAMRGQNWISRSSTNDEFLFSQLIDLDTNAKDILPDVAERWEVSDDGLVYTYYLRNDVKWHDGEQLTAEDVKWTIEMFYHPDTGAGIRTVLPLFAIAGADEFANGEADEITGVRVVDDFTVEITLKEPRADFFYGMGGMNLFPKHVFEGIPYAELQDSEFAREKVVGSGPFKIGEFEPDQFYILDAFEDYYRGAPYLDRIIFRIGMTQTAAQIAALEAGEIQVGGMVNGPDRERVERDENLTVVGAPLPGAMSIWPNHDRFKDKRVLKAIFYALDREAIVEGIYGEGQALVYDYDNIDPEHEWISPNIPDYEYNPEKAKQLLDEAGWDYDQEIDFITYYSTELDRRVVAAMQQMWADVGLKVSVEHMDGPTFVTRFYEQADFDLGYGCCGIASPFEYPRYTCGNLFPAGYNGSRYCNEEYDELVAKSMVEPDVEKRREMWYRISEIANDELLHLTLFQQDRRFAVSKNVCNFRFRQWTNIVWPETYPNTWYLGE